MKLFVSATTALRPILERMSEQSPHEIVIGDSQTPLPTSGYDAILLLNGTDAVGEEICAQEISLIVPLVHNSAALLLGSAERFRNLFERYAGGICWFFPGSYEVQPSCAAKDCSQAILLADTQHGVYSDELQAMRYARENELDFTYCEMDAGLLSRLLNGEWDGDDILVAAPYTALVPTYTRTLLTVGQN